MKKKVADTNTHKTWGQANEALNGLSWEKCRPSLHVCHVLTNNTSKLANYENGDRRQVNVSPALF